MYYWFRPQIHLCESPDTERAVCGTPVTGRAPTVRPLPDGADPGAYFADHDAELCSNCARIHDSRTE